MAEITYRQAIHDAMAEEMRRDESVLVFGEDVAEYGGSFKVTQGLLDEFGPERVFDTPISEAAIIGSAIGLALAGFRPVPELMTVNFALVAFDQIINHLAMMRYMFGGQCDLPVTIRAPGGGGHQLAAQHSHSLEAFFVHTPGLKVVYPSTPANAKALLISSIRDDNPVIFLEHEGLYNLKGDVPDDHGPMPLGQAEVVRTGSDVTLIAYGRMTHVALEAAQEIEKDGVQAEVIDLLSLRPTDWDTLVASVTKTNRAVVIEECWPRCGIAGDIASNLYDRAFDMLDAPIERVSGANVPMPYAKGLEQACIPSAKDVVAAARRTLA